MPASSNHFTTSFLATIRAQKLAMTSGSLQSCPEIICNILLVPESIYNLVLNVLVVSAGETQLGKLFHVFTTPLVQELSSS